MITWLQRMRSTSPNITLFGSVWSPPQWMKDTGSNALQPRYMQAWVQYVLRYLEAYEGLGVPVAAVTLQVHQPAPFALHGPFSSTNPSPPSPPPLPPPERALAQQVIGV